jgi:hypothetical protein
LRFHPAQPVEQKIPLILRVTVKIDLGCKLSTVGDLNFEMDMRRFSGIRYRGDGAKPVCALPVGRGHPKALKIGIERTPPGIAAVLIDTVRVSLPDLDPVTLPRHTALIGYTPH